MNITAMIPGNAVVTGMPATASLTPSASTQAAHVSAAPSAPAIQPGVAVAPVSAEQKLAPADDRVLREATQRVQDIVQTRARNLEFSIDKDTSKTVVKLIDVESKEVLRQFPSEEILKLSRALDEMLKANGLLIQGKA